MHVPPHYMADKYRASAFLPRDQHISNLSKYDEEIRQREHLYQTKERDRQLMHQQVCRKSKSSGVASIYAKDQQVCRKSKPSGVVSMYAKEQVLEKILLLSIDKNLPVMCSSKEASVLPLGICK